MQVKAIRVHAYGGPEAMVLETVELPAPGAGQVRVRVEAAGVNFIDTYQRSGVYPSPSLPRALGLEGAGVIEALGPEVSGFAVGDRVAWASAPGSYATHVNAPAAELVPLPKGLDSRRAAAAMLQGMTAHYLARSTFPLAAGHTCVVHAAAGGVGLLLCQLARAAGARVIGLVSSEEKETLARAAGADEVIRVDREDFLPAVRRLTGGQGVDVVYDSVGRDTFDRSLSCLRPRGMMVLFGGSSGQVPPFDPQVLNARGSLYLTRPSLNAYTATREELLWRAGEVLGAVEKGTLSLRIDSALPLAEAAEAHRRLEGRRTAGKVLLLP
jgi:NADPH2:quinone reductase